MKAADLIAELKKVSPETEVLVEYIDGYGDFMGYGELRIDVVVGDLVRPSVNLRNPHLVADNSLERYAGIPKIRYVRLRSM